MTITKTDTESPKPTMGPAITDFANNIDSLRESLTSAMLIVQAALEVEIDKFERFAEKYGVRPNDSDEDGSYRFPLQYGQKAIRLSRNTARAAASATLVPRSFLVALVSEFDAFVGKAIRVLYLERPELLAGSDRSVTLEELQSLGSIEAATEHLLSKEIESLLRKSHSEQFAWMEHKFSLPLRKELPAWREFVELTERRNLFVHNNGLVSRQYLSVCAKEGAQLEEGLDVGTKLRVSPAYFSRAHTTLYEIGVKLGHVLWRKVLPDELEKADAGLVGTIYDLLAEGRFSPAAVLSDFACDVLKKYASEDYRRTFLVNQAQAYKWLGEQEKCLAILQGEDWSACSDKYQIALSVLRDDFEGASSLMRSLGKDGPIGEGDYEDWPLFRDFRKSDLFRDTFEDVFSKPFLDIEKALKDETRRKAREALQQLKEMAEEKGDTEVTDSTESTDAS